MVVMVAARCPMTEAHKTVITLAMLLALFIGMFIGSVLEISWYEKHGCVVKVEVRP